MYNFYQMSWFFLIYSFLGWCAGVIMNAVRQKKFVNTGFLGIPICPSYGIGAVLFSVFLPELNHKPFFQFLGGAVLGALCCVLTGIMLERIFHRKWWDYSRNRFQFEGYLNIWHLLFFGAGAILILRVGNPLLVKLAAWIPAVAGKVILIVCYSLIGIDLAVSLVGVLQLKIRIHRMVQIAENMQKMTDEFGNALTKRIQRRMVKAYPNLNTGLLGQTERIRAERKKSKSTVFAKGCCFYKLVWLFIIGAFLGDITETLFCRATAGVWMSRSSVVYGPFSVVWGLGCSMFTALLYKYKDSSDGRIFIAGTILGGTYEYVCSVFTELVFGTVFWDYSAIPFNLGGRINLLFCFFWGIAAVIWLKFVYPKLSSLIEKIPVKVGVVATWVCIVFLVFDGTVSALALNRYSQRQQETEQVYTGAETADDRRNSLEKLLDERFPDERMEQIYPNAKIVK